MTNDSEAYAGTGIHPKRVAQTADKDRRILEYLRRDYDLFHERVIERLDGFPDPDAHWLWHGNMHEAGYGIAWLPAKYGGDQIKVHRAMVIWRYGSIPPHMVADHDTNGCPRNCANPNHLVLTDQVANWTQARRTQTHCKRGHELNADNLYGKKTGNQRQCKTCMKDAANRQYAAIREAAQVMGMRVTDYQKQYGKSGERALEIIEEHGAE